MDSLQNCVFCNQQNTLSIIMQHALYQKHPSSQNYFFTKEIEQILNDDMVTSNINFKQNIYYDDNDEYLKRQYEEDEFPKKIELLSEYYKFHRNTPMFYGSGLMNTMNKYYNQLRDVDYKRIKVILKHQQGVSITTQKSQSSILNTSVINRSKYSTMLNVLEQSIQNQSKILLQVCQEINQAYKNVKVPLHFKGNYHSEHRNFENFMRKSIKNKRMIESRTKNNARIQQIDLKLADNMLKNGLKKISKKSIRNFKHLSIQKTTANETISREQKLKKIQIHRKKDGEMYENIRHIGNLGNFRTRLAVKTIDEIYRPSIPIADKYNTDRTKRNLQNDQNHTKKKKRQSSHNKFTNYFSQQLHQEQNCKQQNQKQRRINRLSSQKVIKKTLTTTINTENRLKRAQSQGKILRHESQGKIARNSKINSNLSRKNSKSKISQYFPNNDNYEATGKISLKDEDINRILQKKLNVFKRKTKPV